MSELIPRLSMGELDPQLAEVLKPKVDRLNYLGEFFQCMGHQPGALMSFQQLTEVLKEALPDNLTELVALTIATKMENAYERVQHERLALKLGFSKDWVRAVESLKAETVGELSPIERRVQRLALVILDRQGHDTTTELDEVIKDLGYKQTVGVLMLIGRYAMHALIANSLELKPPVTSPF